ncbi:YbhB/YbcL family Raf kinase inhibitor-like protein [Candidatus Dependentiae bacterium HGW-Dependentiae-1]|nr:MAG: YbhB/YbcL family Raf kinase inhibitor-like protein [Candidatus Dependentiae bacterium HGW-Dependentiae-1]
MKNVYLFVGIIIGVTLGIHMLHTAKESRRYPHLIVTSSAFASGDVIPIAYTCEGANTPPPIAWKRVPPGTRSFALLFEYSRKASGQSWVHWLIYDIPSYRREFLVKDYQELSGEGSGTHRDVRTEQLGKVGINSWKKESYGGPCPPAGLQEYHFTVFALDVETLNLKGPVTKNIFLETVNKGHVLATGKLVGSYDRRLP